MIRFSILGAMAILAISFGASNLHLVNVSVLFGEDVQTSLVTLLFGAFAGGYVIAYLLGLRRELTTRKRHRLLFQEATAAAPVLLPAPPEIPTLASARSATPWWSFRR